LKRQPLQILRRLLLLRGSAMQNRKVVYTAITGGYEGLKEPKFISEGWDYVCFTDDPAITSETWQVRLIDKEAWVAMGAQHVDNPRRLAKFPKIIPHLFLPEYEESIWVDGSYDLVGDLNTFVSSYLRETDMIGFAHVTDIDMTCSYYEAKRCIASGAAPKEHAEAQMNRYRAEGFPERYGLIAAGTIYRKQTEKTKELGWLWYEETMRGTPRDQMSFNYCCWKLGFSYDICFLNYRLNPWFVYKPHKQVVPTARGILTVSRKPIHHWIAFPDQVFDVAFPLKQLKRKIICLELGALPVEVAVEKASLTDEQGKGYPLRLFKTYETCVEDGWLVFPEGGARLKFKVPDGLPAQGIREARFSGKLRFHGKVPDVSDMEPEPKWWHRIFNWIYEKKLFRPVVQLIQNLHKWRRTE